MNDLDPDRDPSVRGFEPSARPADPSVVGRQILAGFDADSVRALLHAACSSPTAVHHLPVVADLMAQSYAFRPRGRRLAAPGDLSRWINAVRAEVPGVTVQDDWIPCDPRRVVRAKVSGRRRPVHPGLLSRPQDLVPTVLEYAECIDPQLIEMLGFGLADVAELATRVIEAERRMLAPYWTAPPPADPRAPARVTEAETEAAGRLLDMWTSQETAVGIRAALLDSGDEAMGPERRERLATAFAWSTREAADIATKPGWLLRGALFVRHDERVSPAPGGVVMDSLSAATLALVKHATAARKQPRRQRSRPTDDSVIDPTRRLHAIAEEKVRNSLRGLPAHILAGVVTDAGEETTAAIAPGGRHLVVVNVAADIDPKILPRKVDHARKQLRRVRPGSVVKHPALPAGSETGRVSPADLPFTTDAMAASGTVTVRSDVQVRRIVLVAGPWAPPRSRRPGVVTMKVDEWCDLVARSGEDPEGFWAFLDELAELPGVRAVEAFELRDLWSVFREQGLLYAGGDMVDKLVVPPRDSTLEWDEASEEDGVDDVLDQLDLPRLGGWPLRSPVNDGVATVSYLQPDQLVLVNAVPALVIDAGTGEDVEPGLALTLAEAIRDGVTKLSRRAAEPDSDPAATAGWAAWQTATAGEATFVQLLATSGSSDKDPIWFAGIAPDSLLIAYDRARLAVLNTQNIQDLIGDALADAVVVRIAISHADRAVQPGVVDGRTLLSQAPHAIDTGRAFTAAWRELEPAIRVGHRHSVVFVPPGGPGARVSVPARHRAERRLAQHLHRAGVPAQQAAGAGASHLLRTTVCPAAWAVLLSDLAPFEPTHALAVAAREVERVWAQRTRLQTQRAARIVAGWEPIDDDGDPFDDTITCRAADLVLEAMLHTPPHGTALMDQRDWARLLLQAALCLELSGRATANAVGLEQVAVEVAESGTCSTIGVSSRIDLHAYQDARTAIDQRRHAEQLHDAPHSDSEDCRGTETIEASPRRWNAVLADALTDRRRPRYERPVIEAALRADAAMHEHLHAGVDEIANVLKVAASWSATASAGEIITLDRDELIREVGDWAGLDTAAVAAAVDLLTLTPDRLAEEDLPYWELERRSARLATRPLIRPHGTAGHRHVMLMPRRIAATQHIFGNYAHGGRLPWPPRTLPGPVVAAFEAWQGAGQKAFEIHLERVVRDQGFRHYRRGLKEKPAARFGIRLSGEIDLLLADPQRHRLWVIEAKDPQVPFGLDQILYEVTNFHGVPLDPAGQGESTYKTPERAYIGKLLAKAREIRQQLAAALDIFGIDHEPQAWQVIPMIVTPNPVAAAFAAEPRVAFTCPDPLPRILTAADPPGPGYRA